MPALPEPPPGSTPAPASISYQPDPPPQPPLRAVTPRPGPPASPSGPGHAEARGRRAQPIQGPVARACRSRVYTRTAVPGPVASSVVYTTAATLGLSASWGTSGSSLYPQRHIPPPTDARGCRTRSHLFPRFAGLQMLRWSGPVRAEGPTALHPRAKSRQEVGTGPLVRRRYAVGSGGPKGKGGPGPSATSALGITVARAGMLSVYGHVTVRPTSHSTSEKPDVPSVLEHSAYPTMCGCLFRGLPEPGGLLGVVSRRYTRDRPESTPCHLWGQIPSKAGSQCSPRDR